MRIRQYRRNLGNPRVVVYSADGCKQADIPRGTSIGVKEYRDRYWLWSTAIEMCDYSMVLDECDGHLILKIKL